MLTRLVISNYALIDELDVSFEPGFNIVTGETGAGKSILLGALSLILGARADSSSLRNAERKCIVEGYFDISCRGLEPFFRNMTWITNRFPFFAGDHFRRKIELS